MLTAPYVSLSFLKTQKPPVSESTPSHMSPGIRVAIVVTIMLLVLNTWTRCV